MQLRAASRELLDAEEAHRFTPDLDNASRLTRARRQVEDLLGQDESTTEP